MAFLFPQIINAQPACPPTTQTRVMLLGDSWTHIMWNNRTYKDVFDQFGFADRLERGNNTAIGGTTASYWALPANLAVIVNELQQNPSIDIVLMSIGGNDMLAGINGAIPGWHTGLNANDEALLFDRIQADVQTMIDGIKAVRPNIEIVFSGYDYINLLETVVNDPNTALLWANLGQPNPLQINSAFARFEQRKINIANTDPRVHYVQGFGMMQHVYGYPGYFAPYVVAAPGETPPAYSPFPGGDANYPTPPVALANGGTDAIHLSDDGYRYFVVNQTATYFLNKFRGGPNATFRSEGGTNDGWIRSDGNIGVGNIRVGDNTSGNLYRGVISFNTASLPDNATITGASIFINRASASGINPFASGNLGAAMVDIKQGTFGAAGIEVGDYFAAADAVDAGCFIGTATDDGYSIRIDLKPTGLSKLNKSGHTQIRIYFQNANNALFNDYVQFNNGDQPGLYAPYLDVFYTVPPPPAVAVVSGDTTICYGTSAQLNVSLSGTPPFSVTWADGLVESNIQTNAHTRTVTPLTTTIYTITSVIDANGPGTSSGSATVSVLPQIPITVTGLNSNYCINSPVTTLIASPPTGSWTGVGLTNNVFNPALAVIQNGGGGIIILNYAGTHIGCPFSEDFSVVLDTNTCSQTGSCAFAEVSGTLNCTGTGPKTKTYESSGRLWVFDDLIPGRTYVAATCDSCGYDSNLMIRNETDSIFIAENDDACGINSSVTFVAPASGKVGVNLTGERTFQCNPYSCNPHNCQPYNCNPYNCNPFNCNCQTCYQTCYQDEQVYMTCYPGGIQVINGILTSDCIGACTGGFCWRIRYQVPYNCNPYTCNCQTCYDTCYDTCYQTCYDTCYQNCTDKCGIDNFIPCNVTLTCIDCQVPVVSSINASNTNLCLGDSVSFTAAISGATCNTTYAWNFGTDAVPQTSNTLNTTGITWTTGGVKQVSIIITEPGLGSNTYSLQITVNTKPSGGVLNTIATTCIGDTVHLVLNSVSNASGYNWQFSSGIAGGSGNFRDLVVTDSLTEYYVIPYNGVCAGDTFSSNFEALPSPIATIAASGNTFLCPGDTGILTATSSANTTLQWQQNGLFVSSQQNTLAVTEQGIYSVVVTDSSGCTSVSNDIAIVEYPAPQGIIAGNANGCIGTNEILVADYANATAWQWMLNDTVIQNATDSILEIDEAGNYTVAVSNIYCTDTSTIFSAVFHPLPTGAALNVNGDSISSASGYSAYQWYLDGTPLSGADSNVIVVSASGDYYVEITDSNGCSAFSDTINIQWTGIKDFNSPAVHAYPNPANETLYVTVKHSKLPVAFSMFNVLGEIILHGQIHDNNMPQIISLSAYAKGIYFLKVNNGAVYKIVKE